MTEAGQPEQNPNNLVVIKTARTLKAINKAATAGFQPLVKPVQPSPEIHYRVAVYQNRETGHIQLVRDCRCAPDGGDDECVIPFRRYYPYSFPKPFAAYLVPPDLPDGERVWLNDLIEDIVAVYGNQGYQPRLKGCEAIWANGDFDIQFAPEQDAARWVG